MKLFRLLLFLLFILSITQGCNPLSLTEVIDIEIVEPGKFKIPQEYKHVAVKYNNINVSSNPHFAKAFFNDELISEEEGNIDSVASKLYYEYFVEELRKQNFFESVIELKAQDYSNINVNDTITYRFTAEFDSIVKNEVSREKLNVYLFSKTINEFPIEKKEFATEKYIHPKLALYKTKELQIIADSTNADWLLSLDYFSSIDGINYNKDSRIINEAVITQGYWNFYDLKNQEFSFSFNKKDTILWTEYTEFANYQKQAKIVLPPRKDAILNAADIAGTKLAQFLIPHWIQVQRMYYRSGHVELKKTDQLVMDGKWLEAAKIWKANTNNPNKSIAAKSTFNMGLACEMQGNLDAALEWIVQSFHVFGQKNEEHSVNCTDYIRILSQRKLDLKIIEKQVESVN